MNKKSLFKTALVSATILSGAGLFANSAQAQAATSATHAEQVRGVLQVVDHENQGEVHLYDRDGHVMKQTVKNGKKYKVWEKAYINDELMYRIGTDKQWIPAKYTDWKDAKLGQNVAVASKATNSAYNRENYVGTATINYQGAGNVRLVNSQGNYTSQYLPKNSTWKVWEKADINHEPMYRVGNQSQWVPAKYVSVSQPNTTSVVGNTANKSSDTIRHASISRPVNNSTHISAGLHQENTTRNKSSNSTNNTAHNTTPAKPVTPTKPAETKPAQPVTPSKPVTPTKPAETKPAQPVTPSKPVTPTKPAQPTTPTDNSKQALTTNQMEQIFWDRYMAPAGYQKGNIPITNDIMENGSASDDIPWSVGDAHTAYMTLHNYHYVNTDTSKNEFLQDTKETADQYGWNDMANSDGQKYQKASIRVTQSSPDDIRMDALWYN